MLIICRHIKTSTTKKILVLRSARDSALSFEESLEEVPNQKAILPSQLMI